MALQAENYALEKQVHSYQVSIAKNESEKNETEPEREGYKHKHTMNNSHGHHLEQNCHR
jgi:hypothetical protein